MLRFVMRRLAAGARPDRGPVVLRLPAALLCAGDIARNILGQTATEETVELKKQELGLDQPLLHPFGDWVSNALQGDLGVSWFTGQPVTEALTSRVAVTLSLVIGATVVTAVVSVVLGVLAAKRRGWADRSVQVVAVLGFAIPGFLVALGLVLVFAINLGWFEPTGYTQFSESPTGWLSSITLPVIALALGGIAGVSAQIRGSMIDALRLDYVRTLRSRGLSERRVVYKHVLRNAAGPALSVLGLQFVGLLGGAVIIEADLRDSRAGPGHRRSHRPGRHPTGDGRRARHRRPRRHPQPRRRPVAGLAQPEGASVMSTSLPVDAVPSVATLEETAHASLLRRLLKNPTGVVSMVFLVLVLLVAIFAPWLAPHDPNRASALDILASPSSDALAGRRRLGPRHPLAAARRDPDERGGGADRARGGRGDRHQLAGWWPATTAASGRASFSWLASLLMALPAIVMLLAARVGARPVDLVIMVIFGILIAPAFYRVVYGAVSGVRHELYVDAARVFGLSDARIIGRHILSVVRAPAIILAAGVAGIAIAIQAGLDFLGLGDLSKPSWGGMLNDAFANIYTKPINLLWPSLAIGLTCIALALFGNALRDELERSAAAPKRKRKRARRGPPRDRA